jgi:scyllo-inositol 2-dehydrogenase (NADP+)
MVKVALVGVGKMGLSHCAIVNQHSDVAVVGLCDSSRYVLDVLGKYTGLPTYTDVTRMLNESSPEAVIISTPSESHGPLVSDCLDRSLHVFCEKPFTLSPAESQALAEKASAQGLVSQVGYHNRFVAAFAEVKRLLDLGAIGPVTHVLAEAYGPVVLRPKGGTWRSQRSTGGGCLYDYAAHVLDLLGWYLGEPVSAGGSALNSVFSTDVDDEVATTLFYRGGATAQVSVNWCDESTRKMSTKVTLWGKLGRIYVDRQECQIYLRDDAPLPQGYRHGWTVRYTTDLTPPVAFYLRGEEYSAQLDAFVSRIASHGVTGLNDFMSAAATDRAIGKVADDATSPTGALGDQPAPAATRHRWWDRIARRSTARSA